MTVPYSEQEKVTYENASLLCESVQKKHAMVGVNLQDDIIGKWHLIKSWAKSWDLQWIVLFPGNVCNGLKDTASKNGVETGVLSYGFSIVYQNVCLSRPIANSYIRFACSKAIICSIIKHSFDTNIKGKMKIYFKYSEKLIARL